MASLQRSSSRPAFSSPHYFEHVKHRNKWVCTLCRNTTKKQHLMTHREAINHELHSQLHASNIQLREDQRQQPQTSPADAWDESTRRDLPSLTTDQLRRRQFSCSADQADMVSFWIREVEAAKKGEVLKLEEFLESLERESLENPDAWPHAPNPWANADARSNYGGRGHQQNSDDPWGATWGQGWGDTKEWVGNSASYSYAASNNKAGSNSETENKRPKDTKDEEQRALAHEVGSDIAYYFVEDIARMEAADANRKQQMHLFFELPTSEKVKRIDDLIHTLRLS